MLLKFFSDKISSEVKKKHFQF